MRCWVGCGGNKNVDERVMDSRATMMDVKEDPGDAERWKRRSKEGFDGTNTSQDVK